jgi:ABC-type branched-subunit amino acid transport system permease subunit
MNTYLQFALLGLGAGALYAAVAQGLILAHRGAGVVNLAHGAMAMYVAYTFKGLRDGVLMVPPLPNPFAIVEGVAGWFGGKLDLPSWPTHLGVGGPMATAPAFILSMLIAAVLGILLHLVVFRPLRKAPPLAKTVASVGVALVLQAIVALRFGTDPTITSPVLPQNGIHVAGTIVPVDRFILCGLVIVVAVVLMVVFRFTRLGLATRAAAENERAAILIGLSPDRLAALNWVVSSLVAGGAGILFASITGLNPTDFVLVVIPALGAALLARLESFTVAVAAGLGIGALQSMTLPMQTDLSWFPKVGAASGIPVLVIIVAMIVRGNKIPGRGNATQSLLPAFPDVKRPVRTAAVLVPLTAIAILWLPFDFRNGLINTLAGVVMALSFVVIVGMAGQVSLMQMTIAGTAGIAMTRLAGDWGIPFPLAPLLAIGVAALCGIIAGIPALRVRGVHLAVLTLAAAYAFEKMILANGDYLRATDASGGVPSPKLFGFGFGVNTKFPIGSSGLPSPAFGLFELLVVVLCCYGIVRLRRSDVGLRFLAIRANEKAAAALGVNVARTKFLAYAIAALIAGLAGVLASYRFEGITGEQYVAMQSVTALAIAYLGGIASIWGAVFAGVLAAGGIANVVIDRLFHAGQYQPLVEGIGLVLTAIMNPEGIAGAMQHTKRQITEKLRGRTSEPAPEVDAAPAPEAPAREPETIGSVG